MLLMQHYTVVTKHLFIPAQVQTEAHTAKSPAHSVMSDSCFDSQRWADVLLPAHKVRSLIAGGCLCELELRGNSFKRT